MNSPPQDEKNKSRLVLLALLGVFALPLVFAWMFAMGPAEWRPANSVNFGMLLQPPLQLQSFGVISSDGDSLTLNASPRDWFVVVLHENECAESCRTMFQTSERIRLAVGRDMDRVTVATLGPDDEAPLRRGQSWQFPANSKLVETLQFKTGASLHSTILLIVDYGGHIVLAYPPSEDGNGVLKDLERLLGGTGG